MKKIYQKLEKQNAFVSVLSLLITMAIIFFIGYWTYDHYLVKHPSSVSGQEQGALSDYNSNDSQLGIFHDMKQKISDVNRKTKERENQLPQE